MEFIREGSTLPIPLNLVPTPKSIVLSYKYLINFVKKKKQPMEEINTARHQRRAGLNMNQTSITNGRVGNLLS